MSMIAIDSGRSTDGQGTPRQIAEIISHTANPGVGVDPGIAGDTFSLMITGTFDGATGGFQVGPTKDGPWVDLVDSQVTSADVKVTPLSPRLWLRSSQSSSGASSDLTYWAG